MITDKTILVTGGGGFIGSHIVDALIPENEVRILDNFSTGQRANVNANAELIEADLRDDDALQRAIEGIDVIFHQAGVISITESIEDPERAHDININATLSLLEHARKENARVILASSCAIYGHPSTTSIPETEPTAPTSPYELQKLMLDKYAQLYHDLYGLETVILRYFNVYGSRQPSGDYSGVISIFIRQAVKEEPITVNGDGEQTRDFIRVSDIVRANILAATTSHVGRAYNIRTGKSIKIRKISEMIQGVTGSSSEIVHTDARTGDIRHSETDISNTNEYLGFEPETSLDDGLQYLLDSSN